MISEWISFHKIFLLNLCLCHSSPICTTYPAYSFLLDFITLIYTWWVQNMKLLFLCFPPTSCYYPLLGTNILVCERLCKRMFIQERFSNRCLLSVHDKWGPVATAQRVLRLRIEEQPPIWRVVSNILNKHTWTADKGIFLHHWGLGEVLTTPHSTNI
jgi:hypothetical protein